jgi:hypothetical protein
MKCRKCKTPLAHWNNSGLCQKCSRHCRCVVCGKITMRSNRWCCECHKLSQAISVALKETTGQVGVSPMYYRRTR